MQTRYRRTTVPLHIPDTGNMWRQGRKVWKDTQTVSYIHNPTQCAKADGDIYHIWTWMNHLYYYWPLERDGERERGSEGEKKQGQVCLFFFSVKFPGIFQCYFNAAVGRLAHQGDRERNEGTVETEGKEDGGKERGRDKVGVIETERAKQASLLVNGRVLQTSLPHVGDKDGEWVKIVCALFITKEIAWKVSDFRFSCGK